MANASVDMGGLIDHLKSLLIGQYSDLFSYAYFGDVGIYPPQVFRTRNGEQRAILVFQPEYDRLKDRAPNADLRLLGVKVICMVDMTPYFEAMPEEAFGESQLVMVAETVRGFLAQDEQFNLGGRVLASEVKGIEWNWTQRDLLSIRAAAINYEVTIKLPRM